LTWYLKYKLSQFVGPQGLANSIFQRLRQADDSHNVAENASDDIQSQGYDQMTIENAIQQAIAMLSASSGNSLQLSDSQRHLLETLRGNQSMTGAPMEPMDGGALNSV